MNRITENYDTHTKDELLSEARARGVTTVDSGSLKADIVAALEDDDTAPEQPRSPLPELKASNLPQVETPIVPKAPGDAPDEEDYTEGVFTKDDGEKYAVAIVADAPNGKTHFAKNSLHFWNDSEAQFKAQFTKK